MDPNSERDHGAPFRPGSRAPAYGHRMPTPTEHCTSCGSVPLYRTIQVVTFGDHTSTEQLAYKCSNPGCDHADERANAMGWAQ